MRYDKYDNYTPFHWNLFDNPNNGYASLVKNSLIPLKGKTGTVLDIGSGDGRVDRILVDMGFTVVGIEPEEEGNKIAREKVPEMEIIESNIEDLINVINDPEFGIDYLYSLNTIEHCNQPERFIDVMEHVKHFGIVITDNKRENPDPYHTKEFSIIELQQLFKDFKTEQLNLKTPYFIGLKIYA